MPRLGNTGAKRKMYTTVAPLFPRRRSTVAVVIVLFMVLLMSMSQICGRTGWRQEALVWRDWRTSVPSSPRQHQNPFEDYNDEAGFESMHVWRNRMKPGKAKKQLQQPLAAGEYSDGAEKVFLLVKCGGNTMWERVPMHMMTTLTRFPHFQIYSDVPGSVAGHQVVDALANVSQTTFDHDQLEMYRFFRYIHLTHGTYDTSDTNLRGGWLMDKFKWIPMITHAYHQSPQSDWFILIDDDSYFLADNLLHMLKSFDANEPWYMGSPSMYLDRLFAHGGSTVVMSRKALELTVGRDPQGIASEYEARAPGECCGDVILGDMFRERLNLTLASHAVPEYYNAFGFQGQRLHGVELTDTMWCEPLSTFHHLSPHEYEVLWEYERLQPPHERGRFTYRHYYRDFVMPYIDHHVPHWDNLAADSEFSEALDAHKPGGAAAAPDWAPWRSLENCIQMCEVNGWCLSWRFLPRRSYCALGRSVKLGRPAHPHFKDADTLQNAGAHSGWMVDRIRSLRSQQPCDPLYRGHDNSNANDGDGTAREGWWLRQSPLAGEAARLRNSMRVPR